MGEYTFELFNSQNATQTFIADITAHVENVRMEIPTNNFEELSFDMNLWGWKNYCLEVGLDPYLSIRPYTAEIKVKHKGIYLPCVFEIKQAPKSYNTGAAVINIRARGTLSKLGDALITKEYTQAMATDATAIARDIIAVRQAKPYGDFGITNGNLYLTGVPTVRSYERYNAMDAIRNLSDDMSGGFDFYFDHDWKFYTMSERGSIKSDITYRFGGLYSNVLAYENPEDGTVLANDITIVGQGIGNPMLSDPASGLDVASALTYGLRERAFIHSNIDNQTWLDDRAATEVRDRKDMYDLPKIIVSSTVFDVSNKWIGDTIPIESVDEASPYVGMGRIKHLSISLDKNFHGTITVECFKP